jgi:hypothetical protein
MSDSRLIPEQAREVGQRTVEEVNKRLRTFDTRLRALGFAAELHAGMGTPAPIVIEQAEVFMQWLITGKRGSDDQQA